MYRRATQFELAMSPDKFVRHVLVAVLFAMFLAYLTNSLSKYNSSLVSVSVQELPQTSFEFPTVAVCGAVYGLKPETMFNPVGAFPPWIDWVTQEYIEEDESTQAGGIPKLVQFHISHQFNKRLIL